LGFTCSIYSVGGVDCPSDRGHRGRDRIIIGCTTTYGISAYHR